MNYEYVHVGSWRVLVVRPREWSYGHQVVEILMALHMARTRGAHVCIRRPRAVSNEALFNPECDQVWMLRSRALRLIAVSAAALRRASLGAQTGARRRWELSRGWWRRVVLDALSWGARYGAWAARYKKRYKQFLAHAGGLKPPKALTPPPDFWGLDFRHHYARHPLTFRLHGSWEREAREAASQLGLAGRIATLHVRESGFKIAEGTNDTEADALRNARIEMYCLAIDYLVTRGFTVVRIGDRSMTPVKLDGVVDLATSRARSDFLELWLLMHSELFIACDSGPYMASLLTPAPCLAVNVTNVIGAYPLRSRERYILKRVWDQLHGRFLSLSEMLSEGYFATRKDSSRYAVVDNTPEEICEAVAETLEVLEGPCPETPVQLRYRAAAARLQNSPIVAARRIKKGEPAVQFLGDGAICHGFAARHFDVLESSVVGGQSSESTDGGTV